MSMIAFAQRRLAVWPILGSLAVCLIGTLPASAQQIRAEAVLGEPFGVGRVEVEVPRGDLPEPLGINGLGLTEKDGRVLYPAVEFRPIRGLIRDLLDRPQTVTVYFLFRGAGPLQLTLQSRTAPSFVVTPRDNPALYPAALRVWWGAYTAPPRLLQPRPDCVPLVDNYLKATLAERLKLPLPETTKDNDWQAQLVREVGLSLGTESIRLQMARDRIQGRTGLDAKADQPLPQPVPVPALEVPEASKEVQIEPIAMRVPAECLYVRFGSFSNYLWLQDTMEQWGGDLQNLVAQRGLNYGVRARMEERLAMRQPALARLLGDTVISDVAFVASDLFFKEGAAFGILFHARLNNGFIAADIKRQWAERKQQDKTLTEQTIKLDGHDVACLSSPDGRVRSFYVADGDFHLLTTSKTIARRFLETGAGKQALGATKEFRHARSLMPLERKDTVFIYLSDGFFRNFTSPQYRIEMVRRLQAQSDIEIAHLAELAAATEGRPAETLEQLIAARLLPAGFGARPDGSRTVLKQGEALDSLRGRRGAFVPIPDVEVTKVTPSEADQYRQFNTFYQANWQRLEPILVGLQRTATSGNRDRIVIDARMTPIQRVQFELLNQFVGPADTMRLAPVPGDVVSMEAVLPQQRLFGGLQNLRSPLDPTGQLLPFGMLHRISEGYLGYQGQPGWLGGLDNRMVAPADPSGFSFGRAGLWRYQRPEFTVFSLQRPMLDRVVPQIRWEQAERPAQFRLNVGDLSNSPMTPLLTELGYGRTVQTSLGNVCLMHSLVQQLHVPGEHAQKAAELLLGAKLTCPLGGKYVYRTTADGTGYWTSTALPEGQPTRLLAVQAPPGYQPPPLSWFRGLKADAMLSPEAVSAHLEIVMQKPAAKPIGNAAEKKAR
jgi:hypothetical protein